MMLSREECLSCVRNTAIDIALKSADFICFIDDDEIACEYWLDELIRVQKKTSAECVHGPVPGLLPKDAPDWIKKGNFFDGPAFKDEETFFGGWRWKPYDQLCFFESH